jgi:hypothetical protein
MPVNPQPAARSIKKITKPKMDISSPWIFHLKVGITKSTSDRKLKMRNNAVAVKLIFLLILTV